jgi:hypothetical protein
MKPIQVAVLVAVSAVGGGLLMKWQISRNMARATAVVKPAATSPTAPAVPAEKPSPLVAVKQQAAEPALPAVVNEGKPPKAVEAPRKVHKIYRAEPVMVAQNIPASPEPPVQAAQEPDLEPAAPPQPAVPAPPAQPEPEAVAPPAPAPPPPPPLQVTLKAGTLISARTGEGLSSERNMVGDGFTATLDQPLVVDGWVIAERGARLEGKVVQSQRAGRVKGLSDLAIELTQLTTSDGQRIQIETETFVKQGQSSTGEDAAKVGAGAAIGAAIGAVAGGGKGAGIGAAVGAAAGTAGVMTMRGKPAVLRAETHINFRLRTTVTITEQQSARS